MQIFIDFETRPSVDGGIALLGIGERGGLPIGELLPLADLHLEKDGKNLLEAHVGDAILLDELLQLDEAGRAAVTDACKLMKIVTRGETYLDARLIFKVLLEELRNTSFVQAEEEGIARG